MLFSCWNFSKRAFIVIGRIFKIWKPEEDETDSRRKRLFTAMQQVTTWSAMAYPTWLVFFDNKAEFADLFFEIYISFNYKFIVVRSSAIESGQDIITEFIKLIEGKNWDWIHSVCGTWERAWKGQHAATFYKETIFMARIYASHRFMWGYSFYSSRSSSAIDYSLIGEDY